MLKHLHIQNYALITHLDIDFNAGFSVLTGETGAGKSIILGALALVLGARADSKVITDGETKCIIEAEFDDCIIRRELYSNGKSRSFVDDSVVTLQELKALSNRLIDIHSQHANLLIENMEFQFGVIDTIADNETLLSDYTQCFEQYLQAAQALQDIQSLAQKSQQEADFIQYRYKILEEANLQSGELEQLEQEQYRLSHAEELRTALDHTIHILTGENGSVTDLLRVCNIENVAANLQERIESARLELQDISQEAERYFNNIEMDPQRLAWVEERIDQLNGLMYKFSAQSIDELIEEHNQLGDKVNRLDSFDYEIEQAQKKLDALKTSLTQKANALTQSRTNTIPSICKRIIEGMKNLGIPHAKVEIPILPTDDFTPNGCDSLQLLFAANLNQSLRPVSEVASGGETSRLMLCIKSLIASSKGLPTIIFDEIDTGVSGNIATQMATIMQEMGATRQIIAITHLPQIAALGQTHYKVYKADTESRTETHIRQLDNEERTIEIASMLSGNNPSQEAIANAKQLLCYH